MRSNSGQVYLDNAASAPVDEAVLEAMLPYLRSEHGNPSSVHGAGVRARRAVEAARERIIRALSLERGRIVFTSGGTEANNLALLGYGVARHGDALVCSAVEHPSCWKAAAEAATRAGVPCRRVRVDARGVLDLDHLADTLAERTTAVALIHGQNEYGVLQPVVEAAAIVRERAPRAHLHVDAVQSFGKVPLGVVARVADSIALSAHKIHGPKGAGALFLGTGSQPVPLVFGGGQEDGLRSGTENVPAIVGFGRAAELAACDLREIAPRLAALSGRIRTALRDIGGITVLGGDAPRLPTITAAAIAGVRGEILQHHFEELGFVIGTGSACHAGRNKISATYEALGLEADEARSVVRISLSRLITAADVDRFVAALAGAVARVRELMG